MFVVMIVGVVVVPPVCVNTRILLRCCPGITMGVFPSTLLIWLLARSSGTNFPVSFFSSSALPLILSRHQQTKNDDLTTKASSFQTTVHPHRNRAANRTGHTGRRFAASVPRFSQTIPAYERYFYRATLKFERMAICAAKDTRTHATLCAVRQCALWGGWRLQQGTPKKGKKARFTGQNRPPDRRAPALRTRGGFERAERGAHRPFCEHIERVLVLRRWQQWGCCFFLITLLLIKLIIIMIVIITIKSWKNYWQLEESYQPQR